MSFIWKNLMCLNINRSKCPSSKVNNFYPIKNIFFRALLRNFYINKYYVKI